MVNENFYIGMHSTDDLNDGYIGSGKRLWYSIKYHGKENFKFEIIRFCDNKSQLAYFEAQEQFNREVLLKDNYYNEMLNLRLHRVKI